MNAELRFARIASSSYTPVTMALWHLPNWTAGTEFEVRVVCYSLPESLRQNLLNWIRIFNKITLKEFGPSEFNKFNKLHGEVGQRLKVSPNIEKHSGCLQQRDQWGMWPWDLQSQSFEWRRIVMIRPKWDTKREMVNQMRYRIKRDSKPKEMTNQMIHQTKWDSKPDWMPLWKCLPSDCSQRS